MRDFDMADIFLSYTHIDRPHARQIVDLFDNEGWTTWWDRDIAPGMPWRSKLDEELAKCRAVVVLWSTTSVKSKEVRREAKAGLEKNALVPILLDASHVPKPFADLQATDLSDGNLKKDRTELVALLSRLASIAPPSHIEKVRPGYDPAFLGETCPIHFPGVTGSAAVLRYLHFTVIMNPARRLAHYVAYNIDGKQLVVLPRPGSNPDDYSIDPLLPPSLQMNHNLLRGSGYDRGHLMAGRSVSWGEERDASIAEHQAFFWPNLAPQYPELNRGWWNKLEQLERAKAVMEGRVTVFSGPVFSDQDMPHRGEVEFEHGLIAHDTFRVPRAYWKVVVVPARYGKLATAAYLMDQEVMVAQHIERNIELASYRIALADLEKHARIYFPQLLHEAAELSQHFDVI
jgi:DNA/RNA endonuclease G (NUC1)